MHSITATGQVKQDTQKEQLISVTASVFFTYIAIFSKINYDEV